MDTARWARLDETLEDLAAQARAAGRTPYVIRESGATVAGALGYVACAQELQAQIRHGAPDFDRIVVTAFSGATLAGLLIGRELTGGAFGLWSYRRELEALLGPGRSGAHW